MNPIFLQSFETGVDRHGTGCEKWDGCQDMFGRKDVLPLWVADMDFGAPEPVVRALTERASNGVFGYTINDPSHYMAVCNWMRTRHSLDVKPDWVRFSPGVVQSLYYALNALTSPGDKVAIQTPVYPPFYGCAQRAGLEIYHSPLRLTKQGYQMDLDQLEHGFKQGVKMIMLSSPHNPVGRIWTLEEMTELVQLCNRYDVHIVSDEIHMDFEMPGYKHTPILSVPGADRAILLVSATKTFNLAGLRHSSIIIKDDEIRAKMDKVLRDVYVANPNIFGQLAQTTAYQHGAEWLDALIEYLEESRQYVDKFVKERLGEFWLAPTEGTYLLWLDMRALGLDSAALKDLLVHKAGVGFNNGPDFGPEGEGFVRINIATPRRNVVEAMNRVEMAVRGQ